MSKAIVLNENGGPEILKLQEIEIPQPQDDEVLIKQTAIGLNLIDTYHRSGLYPLPLPAIIGSEGAGKVVSVGKNVSEFQRGDRVTYLVSLGAYCEYRTIPAKLLVKIPESISDNLAAAMMLKGCTAQYLLKQTYKVSKGDTVLVHAAAGGVGLITMGLVGWFADRSPKAPKGIQAPIANIPGAVPPPPGESPPPLPSGPGPVSEGENDGEGEK